VKPAVESNRGRWGTAIALAVLVLAFPVFGPLPLVGIPLAMLMVGLPTGRRLVWVSAGLALWLFVLFLPGGPLGQVGRGWALVLGMVFLAISLARPGWAVLTRALGSTGIAVVVGGTVMVAAGGIGVMDNLIHTHLAEVSEILLGDLEKQLPDATGLAELRVTTGQVVEQQVYMFPAYLALQSVAALALAAWWVRRLRRSTSEGFRLGDLSGFRFNDHLVWLLILGGALLLLSSVPGAERVGANLLLFMGALYMLRGFAVFAFLTAEAGSALSIVLGVVILLALGGGLQSLLILVLLAALLMGLGDTWLDVRRRVTDVTRT
jgi:hypothetical protein